MRGRKVLIGAAALILTAAGLSAATPPPVPPYIAAAVANPERPDFDRVRDADRKPAEMLAFAGVRPGMTVVELAPGAGYFTRIISGTLGQNGKIITIASRPSPALTQWSISHGNMTMVDSAPPGTIPVQNTDSVDMVWTTQNYHDFKNGKVGDGDAAAAYNAAAFQLLKPGGAYFISDHDAAKGAGATVTSTLHRIEEALVIKEVEAAGFKLEAKSDILRHPADNRTARVMESGVRGKTDQFVLLFRKPK